MLAQSGPFASSSARPGTPAACDVGSSGPGGGRCPFGNLVLKTLKYHHYEGGGDNLKIETFGKTVDVWYVAVIVALWYFKSNATARCVLINMNNFFISRRIFIDHNSPTQSVVVASLKVVGERFLCSWSVKGLVPPCFGMKWDGHFG